MKWPFSTSNHPQPGLAGFWQLLDALSSLDIIHSEAQQLPVVVFKHSTRCSISRMALRQFEADWPPSTSMHAYFLDLLNHRDISNAIAERWGVVHQSPQVLVFYKGKVIYHASHENIHASEVLRLVEMV